MPILLLRTPDPVAPDRYEHAFRQLGPDYNPITIGVLETLLTNLAELSSVLHDGPDSEARKYDGVIITSKRSCEAIGESISSTKPDEQRREGGSVESGRVAQSPHLYDDIVRKWSSIPFYVVGEGTATALRDAFHTSLTTPKIDVEASTNDPKTTLESNPSLSSNESASLDIRGQSSGNANHLGPFIISDLAKSPPRTPGRKFRLLYLTGDKNRDTLPSILTGPESERIGGIELHELQVYRTQGSERFERDLVEALGRVEVDTARPPCSSSASGGFPSKPPFSRSRSEWWIVHFAPSAASFVHPILVNHFSFRSAGFEGPPLQSSSCALPFARVAAIGPSTHHALQDQLRVHVDTVSVKPTAEALVKAIREFEG